MDQLKQITVQMPGGDQREIVLRLRQDTDQNALVSFYGSLPRESLVHFDEDMSDPEVVRMKFLPSPHYQIISILAECKGDIIGEAFLVRALRTRSSHVAELKHYLKEEYRKLGIGAAMLKELYFTAMREGVEKIFCKVPRPSLPHFEALMQRLELEQEAILKDHIKDNRNRKHDLVIFSHNLEGLWDKMADWQSPYGRYMEY